MNAVTTFLLDDLDIRGRYLILEEEWQTWLHQRHYQPKAIQLLGESAAFLTLLASDVKTMSKLTLQLTGNGKVKTLVTQCQIHEEALHLRGMIDAPDVNQEDNIDTLFSQGDLALTLLNPATEGYYQSLVPIGGENLVQTFEDYLTQSAQTVTHLLMHISPTKIAAIAIEKMPDTDKKDSDGWNRINHLFNSLSSDELDKLTPEEVLYRLLHNESLRLFAPLPVIYHCPEQKEQVNDVIRSIGQEESLKILSEQDGKLIIHNDICDKTYVLTEPEVLALFSHTLH